MRVLLIADDPEPYRLLTWALRDDGVEAECVTRAEAEAADLRAVAALVLASPPADADARRAEVSVLRERIGTRPIVSALDSNAIPDSGADRYVASPLRHDDLLKAFRALSLQVNAPGDARSGTDT